MGLLGSRPILKKINNELWAIFEFYFFMFSFYIVVSAIKSCSILKWDFFSQKLRSSFGGLKLFVFRASCFCYFGYHSEGCLSETPSFSLLDWNLKFRHFLIVCKFSWIFRVWSRFFLRCEKVTRILYVKRWENKEESFWCHCPISISALGHSRRHTLE